MYIDRFHWLLTYFDFTPCESSEKPPGLMLIFKNFKVYPHFGPPGKMKFCKLEHNFMHWGPIRALLGMNSIGDKQFYFHF